MLLENPSSNKGVKDGGGKGKLFHPAASAVPVEQLVAMGQQPIKGQCDVSRVVLSGGESNCFIKMPAAVNTMIECSATPRGSIARVIQSHRQPMETDIGIED